MPLRSLALLVVFAAALRTSVALVQQGPLSGDEVEYDALARGLLETGAYTSQPGFSPLLYSPGSGEPTAFRPPGWPFLLASAYWILGTSPDAARVLLGLWNALGCGIFAALASAVFRSPVLGLGAGVAWALWPASLVFPDTRSTSLGTESVATPLLCGAVYFLVASRNRGGAAPVAAGALFGLATLVRSNLVLLVPLAAFWAGASFEGSRASRILRGLLLVCGAGAVLLPWVLRNHSAMGVLAVATQREPLFLGNNAWARGSYDAEFFNDPDSRQVRWLEERYPGFVRRSEVEKSKLYAKEAFHYAAEHPRRQLWLVARKALFFFLPLRMDGSRIGWDLAFAIILLPFGCGALAILRQRDPAKWALLLPVVASFVTCLIVLFLPRYRYPAEPFMIAIACYGLRLLGARYGFRATALLMLGLLLANAATWAAMLG